MKRTINKYLSKSVGYFVFPTDIPLTLASVVTISAIIKVKVSRLVCLHSRIMNFGDIARA